MSSLKDLLDTALAVRATLVTDKHTSAFRLFNGFLEGFPAVCLDIYAQTALIHDYSAVPDSGTMAVVKSWILENLPWVRCILLKTRQQHTMESTQFSNAQTRGHILHGSHPDDRLCENGVWYALDLVMNRDASFYLDTRNLRSWAKRKLAGKTVLNTFAYTGSLGVAALAGGATQVIQLDRNARYLALARKSCELNGFSISNRDFLAQDFFPAIGQLKHSQQTFDCVFLDPPFFASTNKGRVDLETDSTRLINKVRPLINHGGWLVAINNALFLSGQEYLAALQALCADGYLEIEELINVPLDFSGYPQTRLGQPPYDPAPFNHSTKIAVLRVRRETASTYPQGT